MKYKRPKIVYQSDRVTIYRGDCLEILPTLEVGSVDAVVTDPPYGIGFQYALYNDTISNWESTILKVVPLCRKLSRFVVMPICSINRMSWWYTHHSPDWLIAWYKGSPGHRAKIGFNDWEPHACWGRPVVPMHDYFSTRCNSNDNGHPCPKPIEWGLWFVTRAAGSDGIVCDPFMGSGTTGVACIRTGRRFIGIEIDPKYCEIAIKRIENEEIKTGKRRIVSVQARAKKPSLGLGLFH